MKATHVVAAAWTGYRRSWRYLVPLALVGYLAVAVFAVFLIIGAGWLGVIASLFLYLVAYVWIQGMIVQAVADGESGGAGRSVRSRFRRLWPRLNALSLACFLMGLGVAFGFAFLVVPGLIFLTWWSLFVPVVVLEGQGPVNALRRSADLVRGRAWLVFRVVLCTWLLAGLAERAIESLAGLLPVSVYLATAIGLLAGAAIVTPFVALVVLTLYYELRDGPDAALPPVLVGEPGSGHTATVAVVLLIGAAIVGPILLAPRPQPAELAPAEAALPPPSDHPVDRGKLTALAGSSAAPFADARPSYLYLLPLDTRAAEELTGVAKRVQKTYGICTELLDPWGLGQTGFDPVRHQLDGVTLLNHVRALGERAQVDESAVILAVTAHDLYASTLPEAPYVMELSDHPAVVLSTARLEDPERLDARLWKLVIAEIGFHLYGLEPSPDPMSPLYAELASPGGLDLAGDDLPGFTGDDLVRARREAKQACRVLRSERPAEVAAHA